MGPYKCDSKLEATYVALQMQKVQAADTDLIRFLFHPKFHFQSGVTWEADTLEFYTDGRVRVVDVKSKATFDQQSFKDHMKLMRDEYPELSVHIVMRSSTGQWTEAEMNRD